MRIELHEYDSSWPRQFAGQADRIRAALGSRALSVEHVGSTSVPGLAAKPILDINVAVADTTRENDYVPALEAAGFTLAIREPDWFEHRLFRGQEPAVNLHVFPHGCPELARMAGFRDWLRRSPDDLALYVEAKRRLARQDWARVQDYADAKTAVIAEIVARAGV